jgi:hypothetical protein
MKPIERWGWHTSRVDETLKFVRQGFHLIEGCQRVTCCYGIEMLRDHSQAQDGSKQGNWKYFEHLEFCRGYGEAERFQGFEAFPDCLYT